ncbi:MAG: type II secretion system F family protein [Planctomycetes bacterium]|nr:type II secretion system F family protein [Planctomycetota bacterium]
MMFAYTAVDGRGQRLTETLDAASLAEARQQLMSRGLLVLNLEAKRKRKPGLHLTEGDGLAEGRPASTGVTPAARSGELALFARQMTMMLRAGASVVPAIQAINEQAGRPAWHALLTDLAERVEGGLSLHETLARHPRFFTGPVRSIVAAGEATGALADSLARVTELLEARVRVRRHVIAALVYPCLLLLLAIAVVVTMTTFVVPRFASLFEMLDTPLPALTRLLLDAGDMLTTWWLPVATAVIGTVTAIVLWWRSAVGQRTIGRVILRLPIIGRAASGVTLAQLLRMWASLLRSRVSLLDAIHQARAATGNVVFQKLIDDVEQAVTEGRSMSEVLKHARVVPGPVAAAIATGEESGKLGESMDFVGTWLEQENETLIGAITRTLEPVILIFMGFIVGGIAIALFLPLFDIATAAG